MLEKIGFETLSVWTDKALNLHDYRYNGPDPDMALSKYRTGEEAAYDIQLLIHELVRRVEALKTRIKWSEELEQALNEVKTILKL